MIKVRTLEVAGIGPAIHAMRNPYDSWDRSDTHQGHVGDADRALSDKLSKAGTEHCKHLRMCIVWADITAPLYWWKEFDTYRTGVEKVSCSTMHTIHKKEFSRDDFSCDHLNMFNSNILDSIIRNLNNDRRRFIESENHDKDSWWQLIQLLPSSYNQKRTVMMSYAALRQICKQRKGHKLDEWHDFRKWAFGLPEGWMIGGNEQ